MEPKPWNSTRALLLRRFKPLSHTGHVCSAFLFCFRFFILQKKFNPFIFSEIFLSIKNLHNFQISFAFFCRVYLFFDQINHESVFCLSFSSSISFLRRQRSSWPRSFWDLGHKQWNSVKMDRFDSEFGQKM